ncbi:MAG TPA: disulfide bond formation protein DsbA [Verrucomicrobiales bacterium]|nr:disulfide bond formation protein DsbA [Verrucomicrobiales bacterium]
MSAAVKLTYYLDLISSWCFYAEPMYAELKRRYPDQVEFGWQIALIGAEGLPATKEHEEWFYRRSGPIVRWPYMLNADWVEPGCKEYLAPNLVAEAARELGAADDRVRLALARAAMVDGLKLGRLEVAVEVGARAGDLAVEELRKLAGSPAIEQRVRQSTAAFHALKVNQRPAFLLESDIGDRAVFSGLVVAGPLTATLDAMLHDSAAYRSHRAHFGAPPSS